MRRRQPGKSALPRLWLISDARNDAVLERAIARLPRGSGFVFRHYHLAPDARKERFEVLARQVRRRGGVIVLAGDQATARRWRADGWYGAPSGKPGAGLIRLATVHDHKQVRKANAMTGPGLVLISPVFATRSHPGGRSLGVPRFAALARRTCLPVIALGGMTGPRARRLQLVSTGWAAIDGLC